MAQFARPDADLHDGTWVEDDGTTTDMFAEIDEASADDADYIKSVDAPASAPVVFGLSNMAVTTRFPTANSAYSGGGFTNPNNNHADDGTYTTAAPAKNGGQGSAYGTFGFDAVIPNGSSINSVKIIYEFKVSTTGSIATQRVKARISSVEEENHDNTTEPTTDTVVTVDITADRTWSRADLRDGTFEIVAEARRGNTNTSYTASWDQVKVEVDYSPPGRLDVSNAALEVPDQPAGRLEVSHAYVEIPELAPDGRLDVAHASLEVPDQPNGRLDISQASLEIPDQPSGRLEVAAASIEVPDAPGRVEISQVALEVPDEYGETNRHAIRILLGL